MKEIQYQLVIHKGQKRIAVLFEYDTKLIAALRKKTDAKWSQTMGAWHIADTEEHRVKCGLPLQEEKRIASETISLRAAFTKGKAARLPKKENSTAADNTARPAPIATEKQHCRQLAQFLINRKTANTVQQKAGQKKAGAGRTGAGHKRA
jgi:predicted phage gp36 major capsid-like protein